MTRAAVAHSVQSYLGLSASFIHLYLANLSRHRQIVLTDRTQNLDLFPFSPVYSGAELSRFSAWRAINSIGFRLGDREEFFENICYFKHLLKRQHARLIHAHFGPAAVMMLPLKRSLHIPMVTTFYGYDMSELPRQQKWRRAYERLFREGDLFLVEGTHMRAELVRIGCPPEKVRIQRMAVDLQVLRFRQREPSHRPVLLFCGRLTEKKGLIYALQALTKLRGEWPDLEFRVLGDGELRPQIEAFVQQNGLSDVVTLLGFQPHSVFVEELDRAHLLIQPSTTAANGDSEGGAPTVLLEAQACGLPVLSTYHADIPEVVKDGQSGFLVPERDASALADKILYLLQNPQVWPAMGSTGRAHIEANHDIRREARKLEGIYNELIEPEA